LIEIGGEVPRKPECICAPWEGNGGKSVCGVPCTLHGGPLNKHLGSALADFLNREDQMKFPSIAMDLDGVVCAFFQRLIEVYNLRFNGNLTLSSFNDYEFERCLPPDIVAKLLTIFNEPNYFLNLLPLPKAIETVKELVALKYDVKICTAPARKPDKKVNGRSAAEKFDWLEIHIPELCNQTIVTIFKEYIAMDLLVDDSPMNIVKWCKANPEGIGFLVDQPWNKMFTDFPPNAVVGNLQDVPRFIEESWCFETGKFVILSERLHKWQHRTNLP